MISQDNLKKDFDKFQSFLVQVVQLILLFFLQVFIAIIIFTISYSQMIFKNVLIPLKQLQQEVSKINRDDMNVDLLANFNIKDSLEVYYIRGVFQKLIQVMKYAHEAYFSGNDAEALLNYAQARSLYYELGNMRGVGICENNIGNIHLRNARYSEAIAAYRMSIGIINNELTEMQENDGGWTTVQSLTKKFNSIKNRLKKQIESQEQQARKEGERMMEMKRKEEISAHRNFHLAMAFTLESLNTTTHSWQSAIDTFYGVKKLYSQIGTHPHKVVLLGIELCNIYLRMGDIQKAERALLDAEDALIERGFDGMEVPKVVLEARIKLYKGLIAKESGQIQLALELFTQTIEHGEVYDPSDRRRALEELRSLLAEKSCDTSGIDRMLEKFENKPFQIVFLVDASYSMTGIKIQNAIATIKEIFNKFITYDDEIGYMFFSEEINVVFHLTYKSRNEHHLQSYLSKIPEYFIEKIIITYCLTAQNRCLGATSIAAALYAGIKEFPKSGGSNFSKNKWIIMITDGPDEYEDYSPASMGKIKKELADANINLMTFGYTYDQKKTDYLQELCTATSDSQYVDLDKADDIEPFFARLNEPKLELYLNIESFQV